MFSPHSNLDKAKQHIQQLELKNKQKKAEQAQQQLIEEEAEQAVKGMARAHFKKAR